MGFGGPTFILAIIAMSFLAWIVTTAIRAKHGYPLEGEWGGTVTKQDPAAERLAAENAELKSAVTRLEERLKVLERIATEPSRQLADDIDRLR
ncbi:MAG: hypothetical protein ABIO43_06925 [Sphingomicrobium sp.]